MSLQRLEQALEFQDHYEERVAEAADFLRPKLRSGRQRPEFGIVLGSGLGDIAKEIQNPVIINYIDIPHFPQPTAHGHTGKLYIGELEGVPVIGLNGRKHYYEVADEPFNTGMLQVVFGVHVLAELGVQNYFSTNAVGGLNPNYSVGDIMIIKSHINLIPNPLLGRQHNFRRLDNSKTWRFQPMNDAYNPELRKMLKKAGEKYAGHVHNGTYIALTGPTYETEAECIAFRNGLKADAVGMSTTSEIIVARNRGMKTVAFSCITNTIAEDGTNATNHEEVVRTLDSPEVKERLIGTVRNFFWLYKETYLSF